MCSRKLTLGAGIALEATAKEAMVAAMYLNCILLMERVVVVL